MTHAAAVILYLFIVVSIATLIKWEIKRLRKGPPLAELQRKAYEQKAAEIQRLKAEQSSEAPSR